MEIGSKMHLIAEQLITRLVTYLGNKNYGKIMLPIFSGIIEKLKNETVFLSFNKRVWLEIFNLEIEKHGCLFEAEIKNAFIESIESSNSPIFNSISAHNNNNKKKKTKRVMTTVTMIKMTT